MKHETATRRMYRELLCELREPTKQQIVAGRIKLEEYTAEQYTSDRIIATYQAMIDILIKEVDDA